jgi:hypothetical protein
MTKRRYVRGDAATRFHAHLAEGKTVEGMTPCLEWQGSRDRKGYGRFNAGTGLRPVYTLAHRYAMQLACGASDLPVLHACDNPPCCNTDHLRYGTRIENNAEMRLKNRHAHGERMSAAKLSAADVAIIRTRFMRGEPVVNIARDFPVAYRTVVDAAKGVTWKHIKVDEHAREVVPS